jgi:DNA polymerase
MSAEERREALKRVFAKANACVRCQELAATRRNVVFGAGNADADLMFVGEAPGASEDEQGLPFVGRAGKLLSTLLEEIGLQRTDVFICNVLKCRPPGNRDPQPVEIENCHEYLYKQVELIQPRVICSLGNFSTKLLRADPTGITRLHGQPEVITLGPRARTSRVSPSCWRSPPRSSPGTCSSPFPRSLRTRPRRRLRTRPTSSTSSEPQERWS